MTELTKSLCLNLTDTLSGNIKLLANFLKRSCTSIIKSETKTENLLFSLSKSAKNFYQLFLQKSKCCSISRNRNIVILDEISKMAVLLFTNRGLQRNRLLGNLQDLTHAVNRHVHLFRDFLRSSFTSLVKTSLIEYLSKKEN